MLRLFRRYRHDLAIATVFQDCARFLKEWIEFHRLVGVQKFYLYNNASGDDFLPVLEPYIGKRIAVLTDWGVRDQPYQGWYETHMAAYEHALRATRGRVKWVAFIDSDEFLVPVSRSSLIPVLREYEDVGGVCVNWQTFGTSHVARIPEDRLMTECLQRALPADDEQNLHVKSIVRPERCTGSTNAHFFTYKPGYFQVDTAAERFEGPKSPSVRIDKLRINHYRYRDEDYYYGHKVPTKKRWERFEDVDLCVMANTATDTVIQRFVPQLRARVRSGVIA